MDVGKLPNDLLASLLGKVQSRDPRVVLGPGIGRDAAVIDNGGPKLLVAKTDPVTFASDLIGWYAVNVNANDIACMGARPAWLMTTILLPDGASAQLAETIFDQVTQACEALEIELVGGHTEITYRLDRPIVVGALLGEVERDRLVRPDGARPGDALILTKGIAIEGTAVLAREAVDELRRAGMTPSDIDAGKAYIFDPGISVVKEAIAAGKAVRVHAMHDPTEGGLATALYEMAAASGTGVSVHDERIRILPATRRLCDAAGLDPMGLLASGALLLAVADEDATKALESIRSAGVPAERIGTLLHQEDGVIMEGNIKPRPVPRFARDEVARFLTERGI
jgi:hydrogenase maturation factor